MARDADMSAAHEALWRQTLLEGHLGLRGLRTVSRHLPRAPRCKVCYNPFGGIGGKLVGLLGFRPSRKNPNLCAFCCEKLPPGGLEVDIGVLFADVRGSTALGERLGASAFAALLNRFYQTATEVLVAHDAVIDKLIGDEVMALFIPGMSGPAYRQRAVEAGVALLQAVGYGDTGAPWLPLGVAVHAGPAFVGIVGGTGVVDFTALGDTVNTAARLQAHAAAGEVVLSEAVYALLATQYPDVEQQVLTLRGKDEALRVYLLRPRQLLTTG